MWPTGACPVAVGPVLFRPTILVGGSRAVAWVGPTNFSDLSFSFDLCEVQSLTASTFVSRRTTVPFLSPYTLMSGFSGRPGALIHGPGLSLFSFDFLRSDGRCSWMLKDMLGSQRM